MFVEETRVDLFQSTVGDASTTRDVMAAIQKPVSNKKRKRDNGESVRKEVDAMKALHGQDADGE